MEERKWVSRASSSLRCDARAMFSVKAACRGSCDAAIEGCAVEDEWASAARRAGFASISAKSCLLQRSQFIFWKTE